ncbi:MAG: hypothetical protein QW117_02260 [Candidatus Pacearchaeota archaeon]
MVNKMIQKFDAKELYSFQIESWEMALHKYSKENNLDFKKNAFYLLKSENSISKPEDIGLILVRIALSDLEGKLSKEKKYVILQTYYDEGDLSTIDIVRLPFDMHRKIVEEYLEEILTKEISRQFIPLHEGLSRFLTAGGFIEKNVDKIKFYGSSVDFSNRFSTYDTNDIASYLTRESGLFDIVEPPNQQYSNKGKEYIERCLDIMRQHKLKPEFYSQIIDLYILENIRNDEIVRPHLFYSLNLMKSIDKAIKEGKDINQVLAEETAEGIGREMMIKGIEEKLKKKN